MRALAAMHFFGASHQAFENLRHLRHGTVNRALGKCSQSEQKPRRVTYIRDGGASAFRHADALIVNRKQYNGRAFSPFGTTATITAGDWFLWSMHPLHFGAL
jgi:hypothetical protein